MPLGFFIKGPGQVICVKSYLINDLGCDFRCTSPARFMLFFVWQMEEFMVQNVKSAQPAVPGFSISKGKIVVIDDHDSTLHFLKEALIRLGYTPLLANGGMEGLELCRKNEVMLVLTDYIMPHMSGLEVAQKIKALPRPLPVVLTSASFKDMETDLCRRGVDYFLSKPFRLEELESLLEEILHRKGC
jgi:CheY-like chemotaxis protein